MPSSHITHMTDPVTRNNHSGWVTVTAALFLSWSLSTLAVRSWIRLRLHGPWGHDDTFISLGSFLSICQAAAVFVAVNNGYGLKYRLMPSAHIAPAEKALYSAQLLYICTICASKLSTAFLIARLTRLKAHIRATHIVSVTIVAWAFASLLAISLRGDLSEPWATLDGQTPLFARWIGIETISMLLEIALFGLSVFLVWGLQMSRLLKAVILGAFACRLIIIPITCVRLYYLTPALNPDLSFSTVYAAILTQIVLHYSLIAATIPCTKPFMRPFHSGYVASNDDGTGSHFRSNSRGGNGYILAGPKSSSSRQLEIGPTEGDGTLRSKSSNNSAASRSRSADRRKKDFGDSDFRPDRNFMMSMVESRRASTGYGDKAKRGDTDKKYPPSGNEMVIRQVTEWDVQREPAS